MAAPVIAPQSRFWNTRSGRVLRENLTAYLFLSPSIVLIFLFGIFPVGFAFFVSLHNWRRFPGEYLGLGNYERALGGFTYVLFFWMGVGVLFYAAVTLRHFWAKTRADNQRAAWLSLLPGLANAAAIVLFVRWFFMLLPVVLTIPQKLLGRQVNLDIFMSEFFGSFRVPEVAEAGTVWLVAGVFSGLLLAGFVRRLKLKDAGIYITWATIVFAMLAAAFLVMQLTLNEIDAAISEAREKGTELAIWSQIVLISAGALLVTAAYAIWTRSHGEYDNRRFVLWIAAALLLLFGGFLLVSELPHMLSQADRSMMNGFSVTVMYSLGTVPFQLAIGMGLAYLLFQNIKGKTFFRIVYFLPYITPWVATSIVFRILFSHQNNSLANQALGLFGGAPQKWLLEPTGVFRLIFGAQTPDWLAGPSLALLVIMLFTTWTYIGYDAVVFLAGLGNISSELYEAARIDGASRWREFRHITFPLLSPTTFFLSLIAIIGTFKAFTQLWIMRTPASGGSVDTVSVYVFEIVRATNPRLGYGSALAFVLFGVILLLTLAQNRIMARRVFYG